MVSKSVPYSFTITLKPNLYKDTAEVQYDKTYYLLIKHIITNFGNNFNLVAEITKSYNIHMHGTIIFTLIDSKKFVNVCKKFVDSFRNHKMFGYVCIKQITDSNGWRDYVIKSLEEFKSTLGRPPVLYDNCDVFKIVPQFDYNKMLQQDISDDC